MTANKTIHKKYEDKKESSGTIKYGKKYLFNTLDSFLNPDYVGEFEK